MATLEETQTAFRDSARGPFAANCFDDLEAVEAAIWMGLRTALTKRGAGFATSVVSYLDADGAPVSKTWVLREVDESSGELRFYTDARSAKVGAIAADPRVALLLYDRAWQVQLSIQGTAKVQEDPRRFSQLGGRGHVNYQTDPCPGAVVDDPTRPHRNETFGGSNFRVVAVTVGLLDWVWLAEAGHRRARFSYAPAQSAVWLAP